MFCLKTKKEMQTVEKNDVKGKMKYRHIIHHKCFKQGFEDKQLYYPYVLLSLINSGLKKEIVCFL